METDDEWITVRIGIANRRVSHVPVTELAYVESLRALACAAMEDRVRPLGTTDIDLPPSPKTALEIVNELRALKDPHGRSAAGLMSSRLAESK